MTGILKTVCTRAEHQIREKYDLSDRYPEDWIRRARVDSRNRRTRMLTVIYLMLCRRESTLASLSRASSQCPMLACFTCSLLAYFRKTNQQYEHISTSRGFTYHSNQKIHGIDTSKFDELPGFMALLRMPSRVPTCSSSYSCGLQSL